MGAAELAGCDDALHALMVPFDTSALAWPERGEVLFLGARDGLPLHARDTSRMLCQQAFKPFAEALENGGLRVGEPHEGQRFALVLLLPPRQRDERRLMLARAFDHVAPDGVVLAAVANRDGAKSTQADLARLAGPVAHLSKHKCRVFWGRSGAEHFDAELQRQWLALDDLRSTVEGMLARPGLFAWDRIDPASALLAEHLPPDLSGRVADLGAGAGYLSMQLVKRCPHVTAIDLFEADARALPAARHNLQGACRESGREVALRFHWHDVVAGIPGRFDHVVSNPPFHQGHAGMPQLGRAFIAAASAALRPAGTLWMVANRHLPYEASLREHFAEVRQRAERDGFKVIEARR